jgi:hypothetical protein
MAFATSDTRALAELIQPPKLVAQGFPEPKWVSVHIGTDHAGEEAYRVYLVFPDQTPSEVFSWSNVGPMLDWVQNQIWRAGGEQRFPYVRVARESELLRERPDVAPEP